MFRIGYPAMLVFISVLWVFVRAYCAINSKRFIIKRELQLLLVYICIVVVGRFTFFPFGKVDGEIQPLVFDASMVFPLRTNFIPFVALMDYPDRSEALLNLIGNTAMFVPLGIVWPFAYKELDSHVKVIGAGLGFSLLIEILQLPFYDRVSDIDDLILNTFGYAIGYCIYLLSKLISQKYIFSAKKVDT